MEKNSQVYQIKVTLEDINPPIWRRVLVAGDTKLSTLHKIFQIVLGWEDYHMHEFKIGARDYGEQFPDDVDFRREVLDGKQATLEKVVYGKGFKFDYWYDFGDNWHHVVLIEDILPAGEGQYPVCTEGKRACPPEDVGGTFGYEEFLQAIKNSRHKRHKELMSWIGYDFDPEKFNLNTVNKKLKKIKSKK